MYQTIHFKVIKQFRKLLKRGYLLAAPYGRKKLVWVGSTTIINGLVQVVGVTSVFPFFALASDPAHYRQTRFGFALLSHFPPMDNGTLLFWAGVASILLLFVSNIVALAGDMARLKYAQGLGHSLRMRLMENYGEMPYSFFLEKNSGILLQRVASDVTLVIGYVVLPVLEIISKSVTTLLLVATVVVISPVIALGAAILFGGYYASVFLLLRKPLVKMGAALQVANVGVLVNAQQFLGAIKAVLIQNKSNYFTKIFGIHSSAQAKLNEKISLYSIAPRYFIEPLAFGGLVAVVVIISSKGGNLLGLLPQLTVMALAGYRLLPTLQQLYHQLSQLNSMYSLLSGLEQDLETTNSKCSAPRVGACLNPPVFRQFLELENVTFRYPSAARPVLDNFNLRIPYLASVGIKGTTGSGKSTLVDLILGLHEADSGSIKIDGHPLLREDQKAFREQIGYVPQEIYVLDDTVAANIAFGVEKKNIDESRLKEVAQAAQILDLIESGLPEGWGTMLGERGTRLSGGQRQRIGLARALYHEPKLLILDEATSALDHETEKGVMGAIRELRGAITMVIVAHRLETLSDCEFVINLDEKGREVV